MGNILYYGLKSHYFTILIQVYYLENIMKFKHMTEKGFTLIEIIAVLVILGILTSVAVPKYMNIQEQARVKVLETAFAAASSNILLSFSSFTLKYKEKPIRIIGGGSSNYSKPQQWVGHGNKSTPIERQVGDFFIRYDYNPPGYKKQIRILILSAGEHSKWLRKLDGRTYRMRWIPLP